MKSIFSVVVSLWFLAAGLRWLFRDFLPENLRSRWVTIAGAVSAFVVSEGAFSGDLGTPGRAIYFTAIIVGYTVSRSIASRRYAQSVNVAIMLALFAPAASFVYLDVSIHAAVYYSLALVVGSLIYISFRGQQELTWAFVDGQVGPAESLASGSRPSSRNPRSESYRLFRGRK